MPFRNGFGPEFRLHSDYKEAEKQSEEEAPATQFRIYENHLTPSALFSGGTSALQVVDSTYNVEAYSIYVQTDERIYLTLVLQLLVPDRLSGFILNHRSNGYLDTSVGSYKAYGCNGSLAAQTEIQDLTMTTAPPGGSYPAATTWLDSSLPTSIPSAPKSMYIFQITITGSGDDSGVSPAPFTSSTRLELGELGWAIVE